MSGTSISASPVMVARHASRQPASYSSWEIWRLMGASRLPEELFAGVGVDDYRLASFKAEGNGKHSVFVSFQRDFGSAGTSISVRSEIVKDMAIRNRA